MNTELRFSEKQLLDVLAQHQNAMAVYSTSEIIIESANDAMIAFWGKDRSVVGLPLAQAVPELEGQPFVDMLKNVIETGTDLKGSSVPAKLRVDGILKTFYFDYHYKAIKNKSGQTYCILHTAADVTEYVLHQSVADHTWEDKASLLREQSLNEKLTLANLELLTLNANEQIVANEKVQALNDELSLSNAALASSRQTFQELNKELKLSEGKLEQIIGQLPAPILVLKGPDQVIATTNQALLQFWDKKSEQVIGHRMLEVFPELASQAFSSQWKHVFETGESITNREKAVYLIRKNGIKERRYVDYYYQALFDSFGQPSAVLATILDITDKVIARQNVEEAEARLRMAIDSAELGTWNINTETGDFIPSLRFKEIFGFYINDPMSYEAAVNQIDMEYRNLVTEQIEIAISRKEKFEMEYPIKGYRDHQTRWVRVTGKVFSPTGDKPANFSGTVQDITQRKQEEQRKDDFISIASHELKTPITTLKATLQILNRMKEDPNASLLPRLIDQANKSTSKIVNLVDDLLHSARTASGQLHLNKTWFSIVDLLLECSSHVQLTGKHNLTIQGDEHLKIFADDHRINQVVVNILGNAVKYASESKEIYLLVEPLGNQVKISVKDFGPGISQDKIPHLFDRYYRADEQGSQYSGLGLGLYISAEIIRRHGGEIGVDSELGEGTTFWFTLPSEDLCAQSR
jgi:PAS domain S-box-containing protein